MSEAIQKLIDAKIHYIISIAASVLVIASAFYNLTTRVAVQEQRSIALEQQLERATQTAEKYRELAQSIDGRLSNIEGRLDIKTR